MNRRLPEHQYAYGILRETILRVRSWLPVVYRSQPLVSLASFSREFGQCLRAGLPVVESFEKCRLVIDSTYLRDRWQDGKRRMQQGESIADSLQDAQAALPAFYLPTVRAGERCGRVDDVFLFLANHCRLIEPLTTLLRQLWIYPVGIMGFGAMLRAGLRLATGSPLGGLEVLIDFVGSIAWYFAIAAIVWLTPIRPFFDEFRLKLPWLGELEHDLASCRFFSVMALLERSQCDRIDTMIGVATRTVNNQAIANQLREVVHRLEEGFTLAEAFDTATHLDDQTRQTLRSADLSGTLQESYQYLATQAEARLEPRLRWIQMASAKIVTVLVIYCLLGEAIRIAFTSLAASM